MPYSVAQLTSFFTKVSFGQAPDPATLTRFAQWALLDLSGAIADQQLLPLALETAQSRATTDVAVAVYQYFTGSTPSQAGMNFLLNTPGSGLNTSYYNGQGPGASAVNPGPGGFNLENRYFNLAISQALGGPGAGAFATTYGQLSLQQTVATAYEQIVGSAVVGSPQANAAIAAIQGSINYFVQVAAQRAPQANQDLAAKAIIVGYILEEAIKADVGAYAIAIDHLNAAIANDTAIYNTNLLTTYAVGAAAYSSGVGGGVLPIHVGGAGIIQQRVDLAAGSIVNLNGALTGGLILKLQDASGPNDVINVTFDNNNNFNQPAIPGVAVSLLSLGGSRVAGQIENLHISSAGLITTGAFGTDNAITLDPATSPDLVQISGTQPLYLSTGAAIHGLTIDGSLAAGSLTITAAASTAPGVVINITGGSADDTIYAGLSSTSVTQTITGGGGGDIISLGGGQIDLTTHSVIGLSLTHAPIDVLVYNSASESLLELGTDSGATRNGFPNSGHGDVILGFMTGHDKIDVRALGFTQAELTIVDKGTLDAGGADPLATFNAMISAGTLFKDTNGNLKSVVELHVKSDTYLIFDVAHTGVFDAAADLTLQFYGVPLVGGADLVGA